MRALYPDGDSDTTDAAIEAILHRCVAMTGLIDAYVAMVASRGRPRIAGSRRPADCENHLIAYALPWIDVVPKDVQARGAHVFIASTPRVPDASVDPTVKNYQWNDLTSGLLEAHDADFDTAVLCDTQGFLTEGPGFNIFLVKDGRVTTPDRGSLHGITRRSVLELCAELGIDAAVRYLEEKIRTEPVKFEEYWTFARPVGPSAFRLIVSRLSKDFFPFATAISTLARPSFQYIRVGTSVRPFCPCRSGALTTDGTGSPPSGSTTCGVTTRR